MPAPIGNIRPATAEPFGRGQGRCCPHPTQKSEGAEARRYVLA
jgi:hypothetical protein